MLRNWDRPEISIPNADQKDRGLWGEERPCRARVLGADQKKSGLWDEIGEDPEANIPNLLSITLLSRATIHP